MRDFLVDLLGADAVLHRPDELAPYREDYTEIEPVDPGLVAFVTRTEEVQAIVKEAGATGTPLTARVAGTNVGGLTIPAPGGLVLDMSRMNQVLDLNVEDMVAVIEPGVTQRILKDHVRSRDLPLTFGFSLAPPDTSVFANSLLGGLTNRSLKYGDQAESISGLEVVLHDGSLVRTGGWALSDVPYGRVPFPDLGGLFVAWQGTTGIATKMAFQLWPLHPLNRRLFILSHSARGTYEAMLRLCKKEICDDIGGLSWPSAKMLMGVERPHPYPAEGEPHFFLYIDLTAELPEQMALKERILNGVLDEVRAEGERIEEPMLLDHLVELNPALSSFADFPTDLTFLTSHSGRGLTWIGTYGPVSRFAEAAEACSGVMASYGIPPTIVSRPMRGGHFGVLRFITIFDKSDPAEIELVRKANREILDVCTDHGLVMYKTPIWAWEHLKDRIDPGMRALMKRVKAMMDPRGIFNPGKLGL